MIPLLLYLHGVVDRVEGDMAVVEWRADAFTDVPLALLPAETAEGCHLYLTVDPAPDGPLLALDAQALVAEGADVDRVEVEFVERVQAAGGLLAVALARGLLEGAAGDDRDVGRGPGHAER